jgi:hypothetical protein
MIYYWEPDRFEQPPEDDFYFPCPRCDGGEECDLCDGDGVLTEERARQYQFDHEENL